MSVNDFDKRYERQLLLPEVGRVGQRLLAEKRVVVVGAGGLGCTILPLLVGHVRVCDDDVVSLSNLHRQTLYTVAQIGQPKAVLAAEHLRANNPHCEVEVVCERLCEENAELILGSCDLIIDATDNEGTRRLLDAYAESYAMPWLYVSVDSWQGQIALFDAEHLTYGALFPTSDDEVMVKEKGHLSSAPIPMMATTPALLGALAATEALKFLLGLHTPLSDSLLLVDGLSLSFQCIRR